MHFECLLINKSVGYSIQYGSVRQYICISTVAMYALKTFPAMLALD